MFCNNCGKVIEEGSKFCSSCGAKQPTTYVAPKTEITKEQAKPLEIKLQSVQARKSKFDPSYEMETGAIIFGSILLISWFVIISISIKDQKLLSIISICSLILRIFLTSWVVNIAKRQNRETIGWGFLAFFFPGIALIIIGSLKKLYVEFRSSNMQHPNIQKDTGYQEWKVANPAKSINDYYAELRGKNNDI